MRSRRSATLLAVAIVLSSLGGCGRPARPPAAATPPVAEPPRDDATAVVATPVTIAPAVRPPVAWTEAVGEVASGADRFALELHRTLAQAAGDLVVSPFSMHAALAMTACGARGESLGQLRAALHLPEGDRLGDAGDLATFYAAGDRPYELAVAGALWGQDGLAWEPAFVGLLADRFSAGFQEASFDDDPEGARERINAWVSEHTGARIPGLLGPGTITPLTRIVLTSAVYFKGRWAEQFDPARTTMEPFHRADGTDVVVPLMQRQGEERHFAGDGFQLLRLPYLGRDLEMLVLLPATADGLPALEARLTPEALAAWAGAAEEVEVRIHLPRFRIQAASGTSMNDPLRTLGVTDIFNPGASDLSGMTAAEKLVVSAVIHQAFVDVNEEGTEAAAATAVIANLPGPPPPRPVEFRADRPFLFMIRDAVHGTILFMGRLTSGGVGT